MFSLVDSVASLIDQIICSLGCDFVSSDAARTGCEVDGHAPASAAASMLKPIRVRSVPTLCFEKLGGSLSDRKPCGHCRLATAAA